MAVDGSGDSLAHERLAKIQQISKFEAGEADVSQQLFFLGWRHALEGLEFHYDEFSDDKIGAEAFAESLSLVFDWHSDLPLDCQSTSLEGANQGHFIDRLEQTGTKIPMQLHRTIHDDRSDIILLHLRVFVPP